MEKWAMFIDFVLIAGMSLLGLTMLFLVKSKVNFFQKALIVFFMNAIFFLLYYYSYLHRLKFMGAIAFLLGNGTGFLLGPFLLFQLKSLVLPKSHYIKSLYKHLIPFAIVWLVVSVPVFISMATDYFTDYGEFYANHEYYISIPDNLFFLAYILSSFRLLKKIQKASKENYSSIEKNDLNWYKHLLIGLIFIIVVDSLCTVYELIYPMVHWNIGNVVTFSFVFLYGYLAYKGMFQSQILIPDFLLQKMPAVSYDTENNTAETEALVQKTVVKHLDSHTSDEIEKLKKDLFDILKNKKLYLNDSLNLTELAEEMGITNKKLSELLNQHMNISFYTLINDYRVAEVIERMKSYDADKYTLLGIAYEAGFQSKASFNRIFKQKTGISPSKYKKEMDHELEPVVK